MSRHETAHPRPHPQNQTSVLESEPAAAVSHRYTAEAPLIRKGVTQLVGCNAEAVVEFAVVAARRDRQQRTRNAAAVTATAINPAVTSSEPSGRDRSD
jgi:hypothetical protein